MTSTPKDVRKTGRIVSVSYKYPEQLRRVMLDGKIVAERIPGSPTREARATDYNTWREERPCGD